MLIPKVSTPPPKSTLPAIKISVPDTVALVKPLNAVVDAANTIPPALVLLKVKSLKLAVAEVARF